VFFDDLIITHTKGKVLQKDHYYPFGMNISALSSTAPLSKPNQFKYNAGTELNEAFDFNIYETPFRGYDAALGRFGQIDAMSDLLSSITPYNFAYNNPIMFNDPTGLMGEGCPTGDCDEDYYNDGEVTDLGEVVVTASKSGGSKGTNLSFSSFLNSLKWSGNSVERGLWAQYNKNGAEGVHNVLRQPRTLNMSTQGNESAIAHSKAYMSHLGKIYAYGVGGTMIAIVGSPILVEIAVAKISSIPANIGIEVIGQAIPLLLFEGVSGLRNLDFADIALAGTGIKNPLTSSFIGSTIDFRPFAETQQFRSIGYKKDISRIGIDFGLSVISNGQRSLLNKTQIDKGMINVLDAFNKTKTGALNGVISNDN
jgi:RHS repeat-associated protein